FKTYGNTKTLCAIKIAYKMLASTMQFSKNNPTPPPPTQQSAMEGRTSHTPPKKRGPRAASQPNSVPPPRTHDHTNVPSRRSTSQPDPERSAHSSMFHP